MADVTSPSQNSSNTEKPKRNPVERLVVWGLIGLSVVIICTEGSARIGYTMTLNRLQTRVHDDELSDSNPLTVSGADTLIVGFPKKTTANGVITYRFAGLIKDFGAIHLAHDEEQHILGLETDAPPEIVEQEFVAEGEDPESQAPSETDPAAAAAYGGGGAAGPAGGQGGGRNFDPMQADTDGDGKISLEEAPERLKESFSQIDTNGDGFLDAEEFEARRAARQRERDAAGEGGRAPGGSQGERSTPQRPPVESGDQPEKPAAPTTPEASPTPETTPAEPAGKEPAKTETPTEASVKEE